ncbi:MAG: DNA-directed DNA polymerase [Nanoarchaeota archaeon]|nr:DNA-directed DNA polymerase [Nanoarchaeota archaeon]MCG2718222.1 DNA-directed DNA polymerase [Nanoarchaeota archaeon]
MKIEFFPIDLDFDRKSNTIKLSGRTKEGKKITVIDDSVNAYFWVIVKKDAEKIKKKIEKLKYEDDDNICKVKKAEVKKVKYFDEEIEAIKITLEQPSDKRTILDLISEIKGIKSRKEVDIPIKKRYWIEKGISPLTLCKVEGKEAKGIIKAKKITPNKEGYDEPKILAFDIETYAPIGRYSIATKDPIMTIAVYGPKLKKVITWKKFHTESDEIIFKESEGDMIKEFIKIVNEYNPDYLVGYFSDSFDMPYIKTRADKNKVVFKIAGEKVISRRGLVKTKGIIHLDIFNFIKHIMGYSLKTENFDLDSVGKELIGEGKLEMDFVKAALAWDAKSPELEKFCEYNLNDAEITHKIARKIMPNINELVKIIGQPAVDIVRMSYGQMVEWYLIRKAHEHNEICPNRPGPNTINERMVGSYKGAFVYKPEPGLYENLVIMDFKGLYPSIIATHNISAITLTDKKGIKTPPVEVEDGHKVNYYFKKKDGFITKAIKELIQKRNAVKELLVKDKKNATLNARSYALKTVANSSYGYMGFFAARWYSREAAEAITAYGRDYITKTIKKAEKEFKVVYGDTDSIVLLMGKKTRKDAKKFLEKINKTLPGYLELELEGFFPRGIFVMKKGEATGAKKKYALLNEEGDMIVKGFETIRRDWSKLAKSVQRKVLKIILKDNSPKKALSYVQNVIDDLRKKKYEIEDMVIQTTLQKPLDTYQQIGPHVAVARRMLAKGMFVTQGSTIKYVISEGKGKIRDKARIPQEAENYDPEYYVNNQILTSVGRIFEVLGYKKEDLIKEKSQTTLGDF